MPKQWNWKPSFAAQAASEWTDRAEQLLRKIEAEGRQMTPEEEAELDTFLRLGEDWLQSTQTPLAVQRGPKRGPASVHYDAHHDVEYVWAHDLSEAEQARMRGPHGPLPAGGRLEDLSRSQRGPGHTYRALFGAPRPSGFQEGEWLALIQQHVFDPRLEIASAMNEGEGTRGGFYVPQELQAMILDPVLHQSDFLSRVLVVPMLSQTKMIPSFDGIDQQPTTNLYGFQFQWMAELQEVTPGTGSVRAITLTAHLGGIYVEMSNELWADSGSEFERDFRDRVTAALRTNIENSMLNGLGAGQPLGILNSGSLLTVTPTAGQGDTTIVYDNVTAMFAASSSPNTAIWAVNPKALPQLMRTTVKETGDTASSFVPLVVQGADGGLSMLGRPLVVSSLLPGPGNVGDLLFVDWQAYVVGMRQRWVLEFNQAPGWFRNAQNARILVRIDGQPRVNQLMTGADGQTYSPFVAIGERLP